MTDQITAETDAMFEFGMMERATHGSENDEAAMWPLPSVSDEEIEWYRRAFANPQHITVPAAEFDAFQALLDSETPQESPNLDKLMRRPHVFSS